MSVFDETQKGSMLSEVYKPATILMMKTFLIV